MNLGGLHHVTSVSAQIGLNADFYTNTLGLRLVKKSVNQDDVSAYHLFYADKVGSHGGAGRPRRGRLHAEADRVREGIAGSA
jgi:catechol 2,3-dioxygenase-like lactoylglutathione lyase family enzyme